MSKKVLIILLIVLVVIGGIFIVKKRKEQLKNLPTPYKPFYVVEGAKIDYGSLRITRNFIGKLEADNIVNISTKIPAYIYDIKVKEGQLVKKGETLVILDSKPTILEINNLKTDIEILKNQLEALISQKEALKTALETAKNIYERNKKLYEKKAISKEKLEISETSYKKAKANYDNLLKKINNLEKNINQKLNLIKIKENQLNYLSIKAPIDGKIDKIFLKIGNLAPVGKPILKLISNNNYKITFSFPNNLDIREGKKVYLKFNNKYVESSILKIYPQTDRNFLNVGEIRVNSIPDNIKSGSLINLKVVLKELKGKIVPINSILELSDGSYLITNKNNKFVKVPVKVLGKNERFAVVETPLNTGTAVAVAEESKLKKLITGKKGKIILKDNLSGKKDE